MHPYSLDTLQLAECQLDLQEIFGAIRHSPALARTLRVIDTSYNRFTDEAAKYLQPFLLNTSALEVG